MKYTLKLLIVVMLMSFVYSAFYPTFASAQVGNPYGQQPPVVPNNAGDTGIWVDIKRIVREALEQGKSLEEAGRLATEFVAGGGIPAPYEIITVTRDANGNIIMTCTNGSVVIMPPVNPPASPTPAPFCNRTCNQDYECQGAFDGCNTCVNNRCQAPPQCGTQCTIPGDCQAAKDGCTFCGNNNQCQPQPTPLATPVPQCNSQCTIPGDCQAARDGCTVCGSNGRCQAPPTPTPAPQCNSQCTIPADCQAAKDGCTICSDNGRCQAPPSPTPDFNEAMCKCDGMEATAIVPGQETTFTAYGKVEGADVSKARIGTIELFLGEGDDDSATVIAKSGKLQAQEISRDSQKVRYSVTWKVMIPKELKKGTTYRVWSQTKCQQLVNAQVLAESTTNNPGLFGRIFNFFNGIFGKKSSAPVAVQSQPSASPSMSTSTSSARRSLKLDTLRFGSGPVGKIIEETCKTIKFKIE